MDKLKIDVIEIVIAIMIFIITSNVIAIRKDLRVINKDILLKSEKYYENKEGEIINR